VNALDERPASAGRSRIAELEKRQQLLLQLAQRMNAQGDAARGADGL